MSVLAQKKLVEFNSVCKIPFVLFAVQSVPSIFGFTVVLRGFACLRCSLPPWEGWGLELPGFQIFLQKLFWQADVEANIFHESAQTNVMKNMISHTENEMPHQGSTQKEKRIADQTEHANCIQDGLV